MARRIPDFVTTEPAPNLLKLLDEYATQCRDYEDALLDLRAAIRAGLGLVVCDVAERPAAGAAAVNKIYVVTQAGSPTQVQVCVPNSSGSYEWITLQQST